MRESCFSWALKQLKLGKKLRREGWNGKGLCVEMQTPDAHSKMTNAYLFLSTPLESPHTYSRVPWVPSQGDLMALDWVVVGEK